MPIARLPALSVLGALLLAGAGCDLGRDAAVHPESPDSSSVGTGNTIGFRMTREAARQVVSECDSVHGTATYLDGKTTRFTFATAEVVDLDGQVRLPKIPLKNCLIELVFVDRGGKARLKLTVRLVVVSADADTGMASELPDPSVTGLPVVLLPVGDASWEPGILHNLGAGSGLRILDQNSMVVVDFGRIDSLFAGRKILRARLLLRGFSSSSAPSRIRIASGTIPRGWKEGNGHWYWWGGSRHNDYEVAYQFWPNFVPPSGTADPALATGIRADRNPEIGSGWKAADTIIWDGTLSSVPSYPARELLSPAEFDLTEAVKAMVASGTSRAFAIRAVDVMAPGHVQFLSKEHQDGAILGPRLVVELAPDSASGGDAEFRPLADTWIDSSDRNTGLGSGAMLWRNGDMILFDFGNLPAALAGGKSIASAELVLTGWSGLKGASDGSEGVSIEYGTIPLGWKEGRGHWYWFDGAGHNGYDSVYRNWPDYLPPPSAVQPSLDDGVHWSIAGDIRSGFDPEGRFDAAFAFTDPGIYPTRAAATTVSLDVTEALRAQLATGLARGFALRRTVASNSPRVVLGVFTKDMAPSVAPVLRVRFAR